MPSNQLPVAGTRITAALLGKAIPGFAYKAAQTSLSSSTALTADPDLVVALNASTVYEVRMVLANCSGGASGGLSYAFTVPAGTTGDYCAVQNSLAGTIQLLDSGSWTATLATNCNAGVLVTGLLITGGNAGNLTLTWAQNTSNATATVVGADSFLSARQAI